MRISDQDVRGRHVISADGQIIGTVEGIYIDSADLRVDCIAVAVRKEAAEALGLTYSAFHRTHLEIAGNQIQSIGETVVLAVPIATLRTPVVASAPQAPPPSVPTNGTTARRA